MTARTAAEALAVMLERRLAYLSRAAEALADEYPGEQAMGGFCTLLRATYADVGRLATMIRERR